jgi:2-keto-4-pentenoate hydratase
MGLIFRKCAMTLTHVNSNEVLSAGVGAACLGNPLNAVVWLARTMYERGAPLKAGDVVLSGDLGPMVTVEPGESYTTRIDGLGEVTAVFGT